MNQLVQRRGVVRQKVTRLETFVLNADLARLCLADVEVRAVKLEDWYREFDIVQSEIELLNADADSVQMEEDRKAFEDKYFALSATLATWLTQLKSAPLTSPAVPPSPAATIKLPVLELPNFSGDYLEWYSFYDLFMALVHNNSTLAPAQKLHYLKFALQGEANKLIASIPVTDANYQEAWDILSGRYQNERKIIQSHMEAIFSQGVLQAESANGLRKLVDTTVEHVRALHVLQQPTDHWDSILVHIVASRLDPDSRRQWEIATPSQQLPSFNEMKTFLDNRCRALEASGTIESKEKNQNRSKPSKTTTTCLAVGSLKCVVCTKDHAVHKCPQFLGMTPRMRKDLIAQNSFCFNCLRDGHPARRCKSTVCRTCKGRHHSLLHFGPEDEITSASPGGKGNSEPTVATIALAAKYSHSVETVLLATAQVLVKDVTGQYLECRALLDSGSQSSFVTDACTRRLGLRRSRIKCNIKGIGVDQSVPVRGQVSLDMKSGVRESTAQVNAIILDRITTDLPVTKIDSSNWTHLDGILLADPNYHTPGPVDILLGADIVANVLEDGKITGPSGRPVASNTSFGWIVHGKVETASSSTSQHQCFTSFHVVMGLEDQLRCFWELEELPNAPSWSAEEQHCDNHFKATHQRNQHGRYVVSLPWHEDEKQLGNTKKMAITRFKNLERKLEKDLELRGAYNKFVEEYFQLGHMEQIPLEEQNETVNRTCYLPHHAVVRKENNITKLRVVFDGSAASSTGVSLNQKLMVGPTIQDDLRNLLLRFRKHKVAFTADIEKMYRQVLVNRQDADFQRVVWRENPLQELQEFRLTTVTYGTASAPFLAVKALHQLADDSQTEFEEASKVVKRDFYVDDLMSGMPDLEGALRIQAELNTLLAGGGFTLRKWSSNYAELMQANQDGTGDVCVTVNVGGEHSTKILGIWWNTAEDYFSFRVHQPELNNGVITKRSILANISKLFDPLGWLAPTVLTAKMMIQKLWLLGVGWDDQIEPDLEHHWTEFTKELPLLETIQIPRWVVGKGSICSFVIHGFCDASEGAYGAVTYLRTTNADGESFVHLLTSRTRVAPVKQVSLPRLELCGALLLAKLMALTAEALQLENYTFRAWTDSTVVLSWLSGHPSRWKSFIANRVSQIQTLVSPTLWGHIASADNPADCASRGLSPACLPSYSLWWRGPEWLTRNETQWPTSIWSTDESSLKECKRKAIIALPTLEAGGLLTQCSTLRRLQRVTAYCLRFVRNVRSKPDNRQVGVLTPSELNESLKFWIQSSQATSFPDEMSLLTSGRSISSSSKLSSLTPFLDGEGLLRVGGRLQSAKLSYDAKHQLILASHHMLTELVVIAEHRRLLHAGPLLVLASLRRQYWILNGRDVVRRLIHQCITCHRWRAEGSTQLMGSLPTHRVEPVRPFLRCGVDLAGPILTRPSRGRGVKRMKSYICVFVCMVVKAVHLELVSDLTSEAFLAAFRRFVARRGMCQEIHCDNGTNFVGAEKEMDKWKNMARSSSNDSIACHLAEEGVKWHFIPPRAPHFGGLWEASVKSVKHHLHRVIGESVLTFEEMSTLLAQIEACLNSRPLTPLSSNPDDLTTLTPGHFLIGDALTALPEPDLTALQINRLSRWQLIQHLAQHFWKRWSDEYLTSLQQRKKWKDIKASIKVGDLVLLKEENSPRLRWKRARVIELHPGEDGLTRVVSVKTDSGKMKRPISKICPLPIEL